MLKAGDEIRSLARFTSTQRTAFRKLLKKYKKWTGSANLETRFREEVLDDPKSFTKLDLGPLLDQYSTTLRNIRELYESRTKQSAAQEGRKDSATTASGSVIDRLRNVLAERSPVQFDTSIATVPLGADAEIANYFVHPENVVELQVLLLQYLQYYNYRSRTNSTATAVSQSTATAFTSQSDAVAADYFFLVADNKERFAQDQSTITIHEREHASGCIAQMAKATVRWNHAEDAVLAARVGPNLVKAASLKRKNINSFFDRKSAAPKRAELEDDDRLISLRREIFKDHTIRPLYQVSTCRSRFTSIHGDLNSLTLATLDTSVEMQDISYATTNAAPISFPFALLQVRSEGAGGASLLAALAASHLVERVRGFSLQYHALWEVCKPENVSPPFWMPMLSQDIRKLPPPAIKRNGSAVGSASGSQSVAVATPSSGSNHGFTDATTAVESSRTNSATVDLLAASPLRSFRKKRRRLRAEEPHEQQRYWSEYDHPEDVEDGGDSYVIYIDPNERSTLDRLFDRVEGWFSRGEPEEDALIHPTDIPDDDTSDEEDGLLRSKIPLYGTMSRTFSPNKVDGHSWTPVQQPFLPQLTSICFFASFAIWIVAYILATTSKHKFVAEVDVGIIFAIACSLAFAVIGFIPLTRRENESWFSLGVAVGVLIVDVLCCSLLIAWVLG